MDRMDLTYTRIGEGQRSDRAYAAYAGGTFIGYVVGDGNGGWSTQPELDPAVPVAPPAEFVYAYLSRSRAAALLVGEARDAGVIG